MTPSLPSNEVDPAAIALRLHRPIVLVGLMGTGKTTIGRRVADLLGTRFADVDEEIERAANRTVAELFEAHGEAYFRDGERRVLSRLLQGEYGVIASGGGAFTIPETRSMVLDQALAVWLDCDVDTLVRRTARRDGRPLLKSGNPREILSRLAEEREPAYAQAHARVVTDGISHGEAAWRILAAVDTWL